MGFGWRLRPLFFAASALLAGCASPVTPAGMDAAMRDAPRPPDTRAVAVDTRTADDALDSAMDDAPADAAIDQAPPENPVIIDPGCTTMLGAPCRSARDCGTCLGLQCDTTYAGGLCTRACTSDAQCGDRTRHTCARGTCRPRCTPADDVNPAGGLECRGTAALCFATEPDIDPCRGACFPSCYTEPPAGASEQWSCAQGLACEPYSGECGGTPPDDARAPIGRACRFDADCKSGRCLDEARNPGWIAGYCIGLGIQLDATGYIDGQPLPRSNCPPGAVVVPAEYEGRESIQGDVARCAAACDAVTPCRAGYECDQGPVAGSDVVFTTGYCAPIRDCDDAAHRALPNHGCPATHHCAPRLDADSCATGRGVCTPGSADEPRDASVACSPRDAGDANTSSLVNCRN